MKVARLLLTSSLLMSGPYLSFSATPPPEAKPGLMAGYGKLPISFEVNQGQSDAQVLYSSRGKGYSLFLTDSSAVLRLTRHDAMAKKPLDNDSGGPAGQSDVVRMEFVSPASGLKVVGEDKLPGASNYMIGNEPAKWHTSVPTYAKVKYEGVYPGVDLVYYGNQAQLEYDFIVAPNANTKPVRLRFSGAKKLSLDPNGNLTVAAKNGEIAFHKPVVYQLRDGRREPVKGRFQLLADKTIGFAIGKYDHSRELVIDPTLAYSTYIGGSAFDYVKAVAVDCDGNVYLTGAASSADFPVTSGVFQPNYNGVAGFPDAFVAKMNADASALIYSTYLGGAGLENIGNGIAVSDKGEAYIAGVTWTSDFPVTPGAFKTVTKSNFSNGFVSKLNSTGTALLYSSYIGGNTPLNDTLIVTDSANAIALDKQGNVFVTGSTDAIDFPTTPNAFQRVDKGVANGGQNAFVTELNPELSALKYSSLLGGTGSSDPYSIFEGTQYAGDISNAVALDGEGNVFIAGYTFSSDFPVTREAFQKINHGAANFDSNAFVAKFDPVGGALLYSTYLGGSGFPIVLPPGFPPGYGGVSSVGDSVNGIAVDRWGNAYVAGQVFSTDFPITANALQKVNKGGPLQAPDTFVTKLDPNGSLLFSTYLGGSGIQVPSGFLGSIGFGDTANAIALDKAGYVYLVGDSSSADFPVTGNAFQKSNNAAPLGFDNAYISKLDPSLTTLIYSTFLGGSGTEAFFFSGSPGGDFGSGIALDRSGNAYIGGEARSPDFHVSRTAFQKINKENELTQQGGPAANGFAAKFILDPDPAPKPTKTTLTSTNPDQKAGSTVTFTVKVTSSIAEIIPQGVVHGTLDNDPPVTVRLDDNGNAAYTTRKLPAGEHTISANYSGDGVNAESFAFITQTIYANAASVQEVSGSGQKAPVGIPFASPLIVHVSDEHGDAVPGAVVNFGGSGVSFSSSTAVADKNGDAAVQAIPTKAGSVYAVATVKGVTSAAAFTLTGLGK